MDCVDVDLLTACQVNPMLSTLYGKPQLLLQQIVPKRRRRLALHALWQPCMRGHAVLKTAVLCRFTSQRIPQHRTRPTTSVMVCTFLSSSLISARHGKLVKDVCM